MEVRGALEVFRRSEDLHGVRYLRFLGDGDFKAAYGEGVDIEKLECIGHVQKRMGNRLIALKARKKELSDGKNTHPGCYSENPNFL